MKRVGVVGGGPAGLRAAEIAAGRGISVHVFDAMPSVGRKFLVAGRGGLNITNSEDQASFVARYSSGFPVDLIRAFPPEELQGWVQGFDIPTFVGSGKRIYPDGMKSAPLLRRWIARLRAMGVVFHMRHRWVGFCHEIPLNLKFATPDGPHSFPCDAAVFALGGASWPQTGSNAEWVEHFLDSGIAVNPFRPANCGWEVAWTPDFLERAEGKPLKNITASVASATIPGELLITQNGLEGGPIYALTPLLRAMPHPSLTIDFKPALSEATLLARLAHARRLHFHEAFERWKLDTTARALLECHPLRADWTTAEKLAAAVKYCGIPLVRPRPIAEAISSAGGVSWAEVNDRLMLKALPGHFVAGEMLDWEAPTGGYLMQGCFATGTHVGIGVSEFLE